MPLQSLSKRIPCDCCHGFMLDRFLMLHVRATCCQLSHLTHQTWFLCQCCLKHLDTFCPLNKPPYMPSRSKDQRLASVWRWGSAISQQVPNSLFLSCLAARTIRHQMDVAPLPSLAVPTCSLLLLSSHGRHHSPSDIFSWFACCVFAGICLGFPVGFTILSPIRQRWETARSWTDHFFLGSVAVRFISPPQGRFFLPCRCN